VARFFVGRAIIGVPMSSLSEFTSVLAILLPLLKLLHLEGKGMSLRMTAKVTTRQLVYLAEGEMGGWAAGCVKAASGEDPLAIAVESAPSGTGATATNRLGVGRFSLFGFL
jgi:hypothetical protein